MQDKTKVVNPVSLEEGVAKKRSDKKRLVFSRIKRRILKNRWLIRSFILAGVILFIYLSSIPLFRYLRGTSVFYYLGLMGDFVFTPETKIKSQEGRTNLLILGKGGEGHEAPDLTDTIIFASVNHKRKSLTLISLPRDIWIPDLRAKLNSVYYWGNKRKEKGGIILAKATVEEILGQPVHYALVVDFSGFTKIIDVLGGIDVNVEKSFVDEKYPIPGREKDVCDGDPEFRCRYETVRFEKGIQHMDGATALKFVRSRNAQGDEGTDFARAKRQQKVLAAIKDKVLSHEILFSPKKLLELKKTVSESIESDLTPSAFAILARRVITSRDSITSEVIPEDFLFRPPYLPEYDNLYVFIPKDGNWDKVHEWVLGLI